DGSDSVGYAVRIGYVASGATHAALGVWAISAAMAGGTNGSGSSDKQDLAAWLMQQPGGAWFVALLGVAVAVAGVAQLYHGVTRDFEDKFEASEDKMQLVRTV
ncbi:MAG: DUF1206 domain-containing protein, partial [Alphaproteobacteria bacterium]|nr:DUF1206 domain-containing protein [Alphaproteobacteria bacterium]